VLAASSSGTQSPGVGGPAGAAAAKHALDADALDRDAKILATLQELRQRLAQTEAGTAGRGPDRGNVDSPAPDLEPEMAVAHWADTATAYPPPAVARPSAPRPGRRLALPRSAGIVIGAAALAAVVGAGYYAFDQRLFVDASKAPAAAGEVKGGDERAEAVPPASPDKPSAEAAPIKAAAAPLPTVTPGVAPSAQPDRRTPAAPLAPTQQRSASRPGGAPQREDLVTSAAPATAASARPRPAETRAEIERPAPPRLGPCTDAVAALGLCTPEPTQRRE
jgi:hypothetical protein